MRLERARTPATRYTRNVIPDQCFPTGGPRAPVIGGPRAPEIFQEIENPIRPSLSGTERSQ